MLRPLQILGRGDNCPVAMRQGTLNVVLRNQSRELPCGELRPLGRWQIFRRAAPLRNRLRYMRSYFNPLRPIFLLDIPFLGHLPQCQLLEVLHCPLRRARVPKCCRFTRSPLPVPQSPPPRRRGGHSASTSGVRADVPKNIQLTSAAYPQISATRILRR